MLYVVIETDPLDYLFKSSKNYTCTTTHMHVTSLYTLARPRILYRKHLNADTRTLHNQFAKHIHIFSVEIQIFIFSSQAQAQPTVDLRPRSWVRTRLLSVQSRAQTRSKTAFYFVVV